MGDVIEFTTWPEHKSLFYKITTSCIHFDVKSVGPAVIGLSKKPGTKPSITIVIGDQDKTYIKPCDTEGKTIKLPNILNRQHYNRLWIAWSLNFISLGKSKQKDPILQYRYELPQLHYVSFSAIHNRPPVHWKFETPPFIKEPSLKPLPKGKLEWVKGGKLLPHNPVVAGYETESLYIIRAKHSGSLTPGELALSEQCGYIPWGGTSREKKNFEVLNGVDYLWVPSTRNKIPVEAIQGGHSEVNQEPLFIGRAFYDECLRPGKVQPSHNVCYVSCGDDERAVTDYEILIAPDEKLRNLESIDDLITIEDCYIAPDE